MRLKYLTSKLYPVLVEDRAGISAAIVGGQLKDSATSMPTDTVGLSYGVVSAELKTTLKRYEQWPKETAAISASIVSGSLT